MCAMYTGKDILKLKVVNVYTYTHTLLHYHIYMLD